MTRVLLPLLFLVFTQQVQSATFIEKSYEYVVNFGKSIAPSLLSIWECVGEEQAWSCAREKAGKILDGWDAQVQEERRSWQEQADQEVVTSGRSFEEMPSKLGREVEESLTSLSEALTHGVARALSRKHGGGIDSITISTNEKKKMKKKKPPKIHLLHPVMMSAPKAEKEQRGKKKKKKKAILKLLILGAVLKAKIGTLLQILSFKLQVKFFIVAVLGLAINLARLWIDLKNKHNHQPQKVIYYEHAQHQHHYDHEDEHESHGWGPWSRSMEPQETDVDADVELQNAPYRGQERNPQHAYMPRSV